MNIGITGTRQGATAPQHATLRDHLRAHTDQPGDITLHHGDCVGVDDQAAQLALHLGYRIVTHPPDNPKHRAYAYSHENRPKMGYLERNHNIVDETDLLIACPSTRQEQVRSGTWATIRYARRTGAPLVIIWPDGTVTPENQP